MPEAAQAGFDAAMPLVIRPLVIRPPAGGTPSGCRVTPPVCGLLRILW